MLAGCFIVDTVYLDKSRQYTGLRTQLTRQTAGMCIHLKTKLASSCPLAILATECASTFSLLFVQEWFSGRTPGTQLQFLTQQIPNCSSSWQLSFCKVVALRQMFSDASRR